MDIRDGIRPAIIKSGLKQSAVAIRIGLTEQQLCDIGSKRRKMDANEMIDFCKVVGITPNELYIIAETNTKDQPA